MSGGYKESSSSDPSSWLLPVLHSFLHVDTGTQVPPPGTMRIKDHAPGWQMSEFSEALVSKNFVEQSCPPSFELQASGPTTGREIKKKMAFV